MKNPPKIDLEVLHEVLLAPIFAKLQKEIKQQQELMRKTEEIYLTYHEKVHRIESKSGISKYINETQWLKTTIHDILEEEFPEKREITVEEEFQSYFEAVNKYIGSLDKEIVIPQKEHSFKAQSEDPISLKFRKKMKNALFHFSTIPKHIANWFRKDKKPIKRWSHYIPLQAMSRHYFVNLFVLKILPYYKEMQKLRCEGITIKWSIVIEINEQVGHLIEKSSVTNPSKTEVENLLKQIDHIREKHKIEDHVAFLGERLEIWKDKIAKNIKTLAEEFHNGLQKVDTIELPKSTYSILKINEEQKKYRQSFLNLNNGWRNTLFAQLDDFQVDLELYHITYSSLLQFFLLQQSTKMRTRRTINENIDKIRATFAEINLVLNEENGNEKAIVDLLKRERRKVKFKLESKIIPEAIEAIYNQSLPYLLDRLEQKVKAQIEQMKDLRIIYADHQYNAPISRQELDHFNPKNLVMNNIFSKFSAQNKKLKGAVVRQLEQLQLDIKELSGVADFNLDSAIDAIKEAEEDDITAIAIEGIERMQNKVNNIENSLNKISDLIDNELKGNIENICKDLIELTHTENINELKIQAVQAETIEKSKQYRKRLLRNVKRVFPLIWRFLRGKASTAYDNAKKVLKKMGLLEKDSSAVTALSDFLQEAEEAVEKLPYVYRRLYRIQALEDDVFFEGRTAELKQLEKAHQTWIDGGQSSCSIVGEKGSGASSLVNLFSRELPPESVLRYQFNKSHESQEDFLSFFQAFLKDDSLQDFDAVKEKIKQFENKVIILEDLQNFYLKKIHGFEALKLLFELISITSKDVFWIVEITRYAWTYLDNTINIQNYFKHTIQLSELKDEQIVQLIMKRHRVSGYNLEFKADEKEKKSVRRLKRMNEEEKQQYLKEQFFKQLNNFTQSNISLALIYWLRSTQEVSENTIFISPMKSDHFDYLHQLNEIAIFTLHALLIHGSLNIKEHANLFYQSEHQSKMSLMVLEDRGVLKKDNERYTINHFLYRQTTNALSKKNIIH